MARLTLALLALLGSTLALPQASQQSDGQPTASAASVVSQKTDGQPTGSPAAPVKTSSVVSQQTDGQPTGSPAAAASTVVSQQTKSSVVSQQTDGQPTGKPAAPITSSVVSQQTDGQPTGKPAAPASSVTVTTSVSVASAARTSSAPATSGAAPPYPITLTTYSLPPVSNSACFGYQTISEAGATEVVPIPLTSCTSGVTTRSGVAAATGTRAVVASSYSAYQTGAAPIVTPMAGLLAGALGVMALL